MQLPPTNRAAYCTFPYEQARVDTPVVVLDGAGAQLARQHVCQAASGGAETGGHEQGGRSTAPWSAEPCAKSPHEQGPRAQRILPGVITYPGESSACCCSQIWSWMHMLYKDEAPQRVLASQAPGGGERQSPRPVRALLPCKPAHPHVRTAWWCRITEWQLVLHLVSYFVWPTFRTATGTPLVVSPDRASVHAWGG